MPAKAPRKPQKVPGTAGALQATEKPAEALPTLYAPRGGLMLRGQFYQGGEPLDVKSPQEHEELRKAQAHTDPTVAAADFRSKPAFGKKELKGQKLKVDEKTGEVKKKEVAPKVVPQVGEAPRRGRPFTAPKIDPDSKKPLNPKNLPRAIQDPELLADDEVGQLTQHAAADLVRTLNSLPPVAEYAEAALAGRAKRGWYARSQQSFEQLFGDQAPRFMALVAATSPNTPPRDNLRNALVVWENYQNYLLDRAAKGYKVPPTVGEVQEWLGTLTTKEARQAIPRSDPLKIKHMGSMNNAIAAALAGEATAEGYRSLFGENASKIDSFRQNLQGKSHSVTNDIWMARFGGIPTDTLDRVGGYLANSVRVRQAARELNRRFPGSNWTPAEVQETVWSFVRGLAYVGARSRDKGESPLNPIQALERLTHETVENSSDYLSLLAKDPVARESLKRLGLDRNFDQALKAYQESKQGVQAAPLSGRVVPGDISRSARNHLESAARRAGQFVPSFAGARGRAKYARGLIDSQGSKNYNGSMTRKRLAAPPANRMPVPAPQATTRVTAPVKAVPPAPSGVPGQDHAGRESYHVGAVSPSTESDLTFPEALSRTQSSNHAAFKKIIEGVSHQLGIQGNTHSAVGDWEDGAENSVLQTIPHPANPEVVRYAAAWYGLLGNQRAVLTFHPDPKGPDSFYQMELKGVTDVGQVREQLQRAGVPFRTLVPGRRGTRVFIYDQGRQWRDRVAKFAGAHNAVIRESLGSGAYIGGPTRAAARAKYRKVITEYEARHAPAGGGSLQAVREATLGHRVGGAANRAEGRGKLSANGRRVKLSGVNAPAGGVIVRGMFYPGGHFIPSERLEKASWDQYQTVEGRRAKAKMHRRGDGSYSLTPVSAESPQKLAKVFHARDLIPTDPEPKAAPESPEVRPSSRQTSPFRSHVEVPADKAKVTQAREAARSRPADPLSKLTSGDYSAAGNSEGSHAAQTREWGEAFGGGATYTSIPTAATPQQARQYISRLYNVARDFDSDAESGTLGMTAYEKLLKRHAIWHDILRAEAEYRNRVRNARPRNGEPWYDAQYHVSGGVDYTPQEKRQIIQRHNDVRAIRDLASHGLLDVVDPADPEGNRHPQDAAHVYQMHQNQLAGHYEKGRPVHHGLGELARSITDPMKWQEAKAVEDGSYSRLGGPAFELLRGITKPVDVDEVIEKIRDYGIPLNPERARRAWAEARAERTGEAREP